MTLHYMPSFGNDIGGENAATEDEFAPTPSLRAFCGAASSLALYRLRAHQRAYRALTYPPSVRHKRRFETTGFDRWKTAPMPNEETDVPSSIRTMTTAGIAAHVYGASASMVGDHFFESGTLKDGQS